MEPCIDSTAQIITAAQPILLAILASATSALLAWGKGMRTPRREEHALRIENAVLKSERASSTPPEFIPPPPPRDAL